MKKLTKLQLGLLLGAVGIICLGLVFLVSAMQILPLFNAITNVYLAKVYDGIKDRPDYILADKVNIE